MIISHVKHYLDPEGINFFKTVWFEDACQILLKHPDFKSIKYNLDAEDPTCINIWVEFNSSESHKLWSTSEKKDKLVSRLDQYRLKPYEAKRYMIEQEFIKRGSRNRN